VLIQTYIKPLKPKSTTIQNRVRNHT